MPTASGHPRASAPSPRHPSPVPQRLPHAVPRWVLRLTAMAAPRAADTVERHRVAESRGDLHWEPAPALPPRPSTQRARPLAPWAPQEAGAATCWARCATPPVRHLTMQAAELLLLPTHAALPEPDITILPPYRRARRAALPASALPFLLRGWLAGTPPAAPAPHPSLYLLRTRAAATNATRPASQSPDREADGARWEAFGTILRERGDALLVTMPPGRTGTPRPMRS
jgi:hypothetical protein